MPRSNIPSRTPNKQQGPSLDEILNMWIKERTPAENTETEWRHAVKRFNEVVGKISVADIQRSHVRDFKDRIQLLPKGLPSNYRSRSVDAQIAWGNKHGAQKIAAATANKQLAAIKGLLSWADKNGYIDGNPGKDLTIAGVKSKSVERIPYSREDLELIFAETAKYRESQPARYWIPLLALATGARISEIAQLEKEDVREEEGTNYISINDEGDGKSLKTRSSLRDVPIHSDLVELGFLEFVATQPDGAIFTSVPAKKPKSRGKNFSNWWGRMVRGLGIMVRCPARRLVFNSFGRLQSGKR